MSSPEPHPGSVVHLGDRLVDFSPPVLDRDGDPICTCTVGAQCLSCYEQTLHAI